MNLFLSPVHPNKHPQQSVQQPYIKKVEFKVEITPSLRTQYLGPSSKYFLPSVSLPLAFILSFFIDFVLQWLLGCFTIFGCLCSFPRIKSADSARYSREAVLTLGKQNRENSLEKLSFHVEKRALYKWTVTYSLNIDRESWDSDFYL